MKTKYIDFITQTFVFPNEEFNLEGNDLTFHDVNLMELVQKFGAPLRFTYLPKISDNISKSKRWFTNAMKKLNYKGKYHYCYCTKSSHFKYVLDEVLENKVHIETSSAFDIDIVESLKKEQKIDANTFILCNGFKRDLYISNIARLINNGHQNCIPILDNYAELTLLENEINLPFKVGIRIASEEEPKFEFYTSRLGIGYKNIVGFYNQQIKIIQR